MKSDLPVLKVPTKADVKKYWENSKKVSTNKTAKAQVTSVGVSATEAIRIVDTIDRPGDASANATYGRAGTASASTGPLGIKVGLSLDTGVSAGVDGVEAKFLGIGFSVGPKTSASVLGNEVSCCIS